MRSVLLSGPGRELDEARARMEALCRSEFNPIRSWLGWVQSDVDSWHQGMSKSAGAARRPGEGDVGCQPLYGTFQCVTLSVGE
jgi:hypothetical protein